MKTIVAGRKPGNQYRSDLSINDFVLVPPENLAEALYSTQQHFLSDLDHQDDGGNECLGGVWVGFGGFSWYFVDAHQGVGVHVVKGTSSSKTYQAQDKSALWDTNDNQTL